MELFLPIALGDHASISVTIRMENTVLQMARQRCVCYVKPRMSAMQEYIRHELVPLQALLHAIPHLLQLHNYTHTHIHNHHGRTVEFWLRTRQ